MPMTIREFEDEDVPAVRRMNERIVAGGAASQFPASPTPEWLPKIVGRKLFQEHYVAVDEAGGVHGAYVLKRQEFWIKDRVVPIADYRGPVSEGIVDRKYPQVGVQLLWDALHREPLLFGLGMGGYDAPVAKMFASAGWNMVSVPFFFRIVHPAAFLRNIVPLRRHPARRCVTDMLAMTGLGWLAVCGMQIVRNRPKPHVKMVTSEAVEEFSDGADELWNQNKAEYGMAAVRDAETLRILYPPEEKKFIRLKVSENARTIGWAVLLDTQCVKHKQFGDMRLGSIVDCFSATGDAAKIIDAARQCLERRGVDLIVSNQLHAAWCNALRQSGFMQGPSNFIFATAKKLSKLLQSQSVANREIHINRGDGDGPINL